jgi:hypothetical protein
VTGSSDRGVNGVSWHRICSGHGARKDCEASRGWPAMGEVEKFDRVEHRDRCAARDLSDAADVAGGDESGRELHDVGNFGPLSSRPLIPPP